MTKTRNYLILLIMLISLFRLPVKADEGMWIPMFIERLNYQDMKEMGLQLTPEEIYSVNSGSLKDAIVIFGRGCTGEIISDQGLLITNHHCGYGSIQSVSSVENDYLSDGFWAASHQEEIPIPGLTVQFLIRMDDVTSRMLEGVDASMSESDRSDKLNENRKAIVEEATAGNHYNAVVKDYFEGNEFYLLTYETFRDIRLAGTPPEAIGKYGADTDNWMWPRHTGDFSMFRVYAGADNKPADYSADNKPFKPRHSLPVSIAGVEKGDFSMILGNPGSTDRYLTSFGVDLAIEESNPTIVKIRAEKLRIMREGMNASEKTRLQYASKYAGTANYWKYFIGQTKGLKSLKVADKKRRLEAEFKHWLDNNPAMAEKYGESLPIIEAAYEKIGEVNLARYYMNEAVLRGSEILDYANRFNKLAELLEEKDQDKEAVQKQIEQLKDGIENHFKNNNAGIDQNMLASMMEMYYTNIPASQQPEALKEIYKKYKGDFAAYAAEVFKKSNFTSEAKVRSLLDNPKAKTITKDPAFELVRPFIDAYNGMMKNTETAYENLNKGNRLFMAGLREMQPDKKFYPNANFSLRLTYGTVEDYYPADAIHYDFVTTTKGILEKEDPTTREFVVSDRLKEIIVNKEYGRYGNDDGTMTVNFLTTHDITGGNSGSPVIDAKGRLLGLAFDGNWEAMSGDIAFEPELQRTINVDIRYVLMIVDKFAGAQNLINEMNIVSDRPKMKTVETTTKEVEAVRAE
ncbi:MAG: S46 family peptidase [Bacteroidales bacterium]|nr:S46 family peptidase [Bacteroidales bacterium]